jgi:Protein of unknown function (DUF1566)
MEIENYFKFSVNSQIINHYLELLAERDVIAAKRNAALMEQLRLSDAALIEACGGFRLAQEAKAKLVLSNTSTKLEPSKVEKPNIKAPAPSKLAKEKPKKTTLTKANGISIGQFTAYSNGTLLDNNTGLIWCCYAIGQQWLNGKIFADAKKMDWEKAKEAPALFNKTDACGGFSDWRLPSIDDFPIIKGKSNRLYRNANVIPTNGENFWSCSQEDGNFTKISEFLRTSDNYNTLHKYSACYVRLVRGKRT